MITQLNETLEDLRETWACREDANTITFSGSDLSRSRIEDLCSQIVSFRSIVDGRNVVFTLRESREIFDYRLSWEPADTVTITEEMDSGTDGEILYNQEEPISALKKIRENQIRNIDQLLDAILIFSENEFVEIGFTYRIDTEELSQLIESQRDGIVSAHFYLHSQTFFNSLDMGDLESVKDNLLPEESKQTIIIQDLDGCCFGGDLGFFRLSDVSTDILEGFIQRPSNVHDSISKVGRECVIDRFDLIFLPPDFFAIEEVNDSEFIQAFQQKIAGPQLLYSIFSLCNVVRSAKNGWQIRINGKKILEEQVSISNEDDTWLIHIQNNSGETIEITREIVDSFVEVYRWAYEMRVTDRLSVLRNISTLYTTSTAGLISEIDDILDSSRSNFKFYAEESVDEFIGMQQEVSSYVLETQREFSQLRRNLANSLSRDLFRVFGFLIVTWVGIFLQIERVASVSLALRLSLVPVIFYLGLSIRAVHGLAQQFESLEDTRDAYQRIYQRQLSEKFYNEITALEQKDKIRGQFQMDKRLYYSIFGFLFVASIFIFVDLTFNLVIADLVKELVGQVNV